MNKKKKADTDGRKRTTLYVQNGLNNLVEKYCQETKKSKSAAISEAIEAFLTERGITDPNDFVYGNIHLTPELINESYMASIRNERIIRKQLRKKARQEKMAEKKQGEVCQDDEKEK